MRKQGYYFPSSNLSEKLCIWTFCDLEPPNKPPSRNFLNSKVHISFFWREKNIRSFSFWQKHKKRKNTWFLTFRLKSNRSSSHAKTNHCISDLRRGIMSVLKSVFLYKYKLLLIIFSCNHFLKLIMAQAHNQTMLYWR